VLVIPLTIPILPRHGRPCADRILHLCYCIGLAEQRVDFRIRSWRPDPGTIRNIRCRESHAFKVSLRFHFDRIDGDVQAGGLSIDVIAIAGRQSEHQELATIDGRPGATHLRRYWNVLRISSGGHIHAMIVAGV
jgi:hypothetical protein